MLYLSQVLIANPDVEFFDDLKLVMKAYAERGEMHLRFDVKPQIAQVPDDWEEQLEAAFTSRY